MTEVDIAAVQDWLGRLPGGSLAERYADDWDAFAEPDRPVVTLFGSYDTGKSSLLRRLLVDAGQEIPGWLTISARHETFEVNDAEIGGCLVRDTPGFTAVATDLRARNNTRRALAAIRLTDIAVVVMTSQLATAERDLLEEVLAQGWPAATMWFVISRFDEAGVNPEYDLAEYRELSEHKVNELRTIFALDEQTRVFVVAPDPFQTGGPDTDLVPETWDEFRSWDGMSALADALDTASPSALTQWRAAAGHRYWTWALDETLSELREQLSEYATQARVAARGVEKRDAWESELDALDRAAQAGLDGLVDDVLRRSFAPGTGTAAVEAEIERALAEWFAKHDLRLQRLLQSIRKSKERERAQPTWAGFASLVATLELEPASVRGSGAAGHVETIGGMAVGVLKAFTSAAEKDTKAAKKVAATLSARAAQKLGRHVGTVEAALPLAVYLTGLAGDWWTDRGQRNQDREAAEKQQQVVADFTRRAQETWQPYVDEVRSEIVAQTADQVALDQSLRQLVEQLHEAVAEGERIIRR
ncbi:GTPase [Catenuloplanes sp. NPDC051500]|uniref:GTPase n=1 Tax=Catenuloplanes sp. NPDC051500 TaxID=3363959 RepID=UPI0037BBAB2C